MHSFCRKTFRYRKIAAALILGAATFLSSCSATADTSSVNASTSTSASQTGEGTVPNLSDASAEFPIVLPEEEDLESTWDDTAVELSISESLFATKGSSVSIEDTTATITGGGTYLLSGTCSDGRIIVDAGDDDIVRLVLNNVSLSSSVGSPLVVSNAGKVILILAGDSVNSLADSAEPVFDENDDTAVDAAIFCRSDLTITGNGELSILGSYGHGIVGKDNLLITGGTLDISAVEDGLNANDALSVTSGQINISAGDDGIHSDGSLYIADGTIQVAQSTEALEGAEITISGGVMTLSASDDGLNAAGTTEEASSSGTTDQNAGPGMFASTGYNNIFLYGGEIFIDAGGDGIDANASLTQTGGTIIVSGPENDGNGALDYAGSYSLSGGTLLAVGSSGMLQAPDDTSSQNTLVFGASTTYPQGTLIHIEDSSGNSLLTYQSPKSFAAVVYSSPELITGEIYTLSFGGSCDGASENGLFTSGTYSGAEASESFTLDAVVTYAGTITGTGGMGGMGGPGGGKMDGGSGAVRDPGSDGAMTGPGFPMDNENGARPSAPDEEGMNPPDDQGLPVVSESIADASATTVS